MKDVVERIAALSPDKQAMLLQRLKQKARPFADNASLAQVPSDTWFVRHRPNDSARLRLFCLPYAGGGASIFRSWPEGLPESVEVCAIQLPGREARLGEPAYTRITPLIL